MADSIEFSPRGYAQLISALRAREYEPRNFTTADPEKKHLIIRHDVDFSLGAAAAMAEQERELGVSAIYFILLRTEFYNPLSQDGLLALQRIAECGHEIGLHFDAALYPAQRAEVEAAIAHECALLEAVIGGAVSTISFHRPAADRIGDANSLAGRLNAYGPRFVKDMGYCSDSRGGWHHGEPLDHPAVREGRALQLLIHPFWWQHPAMSPAERLQLFLKQRGEFLDQELARNCTVHRPRAGA